MPSIKGRFSVTAGTAAEFAAVKSTLVLKKGEFAWETDTQQLTVGDGTSKFEALSHYKLGGASGYEKISSVQTAVKYEPTSADLGKVVEFTANGELKINSGVFAAGDYFEFTWISGPAVKIVFTGGTLKPTAFTTLREMGSSGAVRFRSGTEAILTGDFA
jgi:hypothetical protein